MYIGANVSYTLTQLIVAKGGHLGLERSYVFLHIVRDISYGRVRLSSQKCF